MDIKILNFLEKITDEEMNILSGKKNLIKSLYTDDEDFVQVDVNKLLKMGNLISIRAHTRFIDFPEHKHGYVEIMYILKGSVTHIINGEEITLYKGDLLFLNCYASHGIRACKKDDIAVNFIIKPMFFDDALSMLDKNNYITNFIIDTLRNDPTRGQFLLFKTDGILPIENVLENLIYSIITNKSLDEMNINKKLIGVLFMYLSDYTFILEKNSKVNNDEVLSRVIENYIEAEYRTAKLSDISELLNISIFQVSRLIKLKFGQTFKEMLQNKRFSVAEKLLIETDLSIADIINNIGYENNSYFHRRFKEIFSLSPDQYRKIYKKTNI